MPVLFLTIGDALRQGSQNRFGLMLCFGIIAPQVHFVIQECLVSLKGIFRPWGNDVLVNLNYSTKLFLLICSYSEPDTLESRCKGRRFRFGGLYYVYNGNPSVSLLEVF